MWAKLAVLVGFVVLASPAHARPEQVRISCRALHGSKTFVIPELAVDRVDRDVTDMTEYQRALDRAFQNYIRNNYDVGDNFGVDCRVHAVELSDGSMDANMVERARTLLGQWQAAPQATLISAGWFKPLNVAALPVQPAQSGTGHQSGGFLVLGSIKPPIEPGWDENVRERQRNDAATRTLLLAKNARLKAESEAATRKMLDELRKRGRAQ